MGFLNRERLTFYPILLLSIYLTAFGIMVAFGSGLLDAFGHPIGVDFLSYWAAGSAAASGDPSGAYDVALHQRLAEATVGVPIRVNPWLYAPTFLMWILPLASLSYLHALLLWTLMSVLVYAALMRNFLPADRAAWLPALAFPAFVQNVLQGDNGCLTLGFLGAGLLLLHRKPFMAGIFVGLLSYKPHLLPLALVALLAGRRWRALAGAVLAATGLLALSAEILGSESWRAFFRTVPYAVSLLESGAAQLAKMSTVESAMLLLGTSLAVARGAQVVTSLIALAAVWISWRRGIPMRLQGSILLLGTLLATPYGAYDYDLVLLAPVIAWLSVHGTEHGWRSGEKAALVIAWLLPLLGPWIAIRTRVTLGPLVLFWLLALVSARALAENRPASVPRAL